MARQKRTVIFAVMLTLAAYAISASVVPPLASTIAAEIEVATESFGYAFALQFSMFALGCLLGGWCSWQGTMQISSKRSACSRARGL